MAFLLLFGLALPGVEARRSQHSLPSLVLVTPQSQKELSLLRSLAPKVKRSSSRLHERSLLTRTLQADFIQKPSAVGEPTLFQSRRGQAWRRRFQKARVLSLEE